MDQILRCKRKTRYLFEMLVLEVVANNVSRGMWIVSSEHSSELFLELFLTQLYLVLCVCVGEGGERG